MRYDFMPSQDNSARNFAITAVVGSIVLVLILIWGMQIQSGREDCENFCAIDNQTCREDHSNTPAMCSMAARSCLESCRPRYGYYNGN